MAFRSKNIFLADDDNAYRSTLKEILERHGHRVPIEASDGNEARRLVTKACDLGIEVAVLDCHMPNERDGAEIAGLLSVVLPKLLVVSVSDSWEGVWLDPNFDKENPHPKRSSGEYDINGRSRYKGPDYSARMAGWDSIKLAQQIGELEFNIRNGKTLFALESSGDWMRRR